MIQTKQELQYYLEEDRKAYAKPSSMGGVKSFIRAILLPDRNLNYLRCIRRIEYYSTKRGIQPKVYLLFLNLRKSRLFRATGIDLQPGCAGPGLHIAHGKIVVQSNVKIGRNCKILPDVTIGIHGRKDVQGVPVIGDRVFIGSGARIIGPVRIANDVVIGANAVVIDDVLEEGVTVAGNPAKIISHNGSQNYYLSAIQ